MQSKKILLTNSVGKDDRGFYIIHSPSRWSEGTKLLSSWFCYYPWELAYASSLLKERTNHEVKLIDPCLNKLDKKQTLAEILNAEPDVLIVESATRVINENLWVAKEAKRILKTKIIFAGQHATAYPQELIKSGIDYVLTGEYEMTLLELLQNNGMSNTLGSYPNPKRGLLDFSKLPWPEDNDIKRIDYAKPGEPSSEYLEIQAYASRGCRGNCSFCVARNMYYKEPNWRNREVYDIVNEIKYLKEKYSSLEGLFFDEEVHNGNKKFILDLSSAIIKAGLHNLKYEAMCDIRLMDKEMLSAMKKAGYYKIRFGIETNSLPVAQHIGKQIDTEKVLELINHAKEIDIKTYATFMIGLPTSTYREDMQCIRFIENLIKKELLSNVQISVATPQPGTPFFCWVKKQGYLTCEDPYCFDGGGKPVVSYPKYKQYEIQKAFHIALLKRDHLFWKAKFKKNIFQFLILRYKRFGFFILLVKLLRRIKSECKYFLYKFRN